MEQRAWIGKEACTVYSANVWVALPTRPLRTHTCVRTLGQSLCPQISLSLHVHQSTGVRVDIMHDTMEKLQVKFAPLGQVNKARFKKKRFSLRLLESRPSHCACITNKQQKNAKCLDAKCCIRTPHTAHYTHE